MDNVALPQFRADSALCDYFEPSEQQLLLGNADADIEEKKKLVVRLCDYFYFRRAYRSKEDGDFRPDDSLPKAWAEVFSDDGSEKKLRPLTEDQWNAANELLKRSEACEGSRSTWESDLEKDRYLYHLNRAKEVWEGDNFDYHIEPLLKALPIDKIENIVVVGIGSCAHTDSETGKEMVYTKGLAQLMVFYRIGKRIEKEHPEKTIEVGLSNWDYTHTESLALEEFGFKVLNPALHSHQQFTAVNDSTLFAAIAVDPQDSPFHVLCYYAKPVAIISADHFYGVSEADAQVPWWSKVMAEPDSSNKQWVILPGPSTTREFAVLRPARLDDIRHYYHANPEATRWWKENYPEQPTLPLVGPGTDDWKVGLYEDLHYHQFLNEYWQNYNQSYGLWEPEDHLWVRKSI
ncbi:hypothetical protein F5Y18DRAFT_441904 [Xylariaceae sp. FL1019]|nr:hypothetical protein F5Y18DRAFT_441904 [Xylariaceae sp. FL1019]